MIAIVAARSLQRPAPRRASRLVERDAILYRRNWIVIFSGFLEPVFYLLGLGFGVGGLIGSVATRGGHPLRYAVFIAPALMATSAMNGAVAETAFNFFHKLKYVKLYDAVLATPLGVADIALGEVSWALFRGTLYALAFIAIMTALGLVVSPWAALALPGAMLVSFTFAAVGTATATFVRSWQDFDIVLTVLIPLFLFSGTFYPISLYPFWLQVIIEATPLYHGVDLLRALTTGSIGASLLVDIAYLGALAVSALVISALRLQRLLLR